jgi:hypothetical protein
MDPQEVAGGSQQGRRSSTPPLPAAEASSCLSTAPSSVVLATDKIEGSVITVEELTPLLLPPR